VAALLLLDANVTIAGMTVCWPIRGMKGQEKSAVGKKDTAMKIAAIKVASPIGRKKSARCGIASLTAPLAKPPTWMALPGFVVSIDVA
jgi:hypothetical protein